MPRATLTYSLPDERAEHEAALAGPGALLTIAEAFAHLRLRLKHGDLGDEARRELEDVRRLLVEAVEEHRLPIE